MVVAAFRSFATGWSEVKQTLKAGWLAKDDEIVYALVYIGIYKDSYIVKKQQSYLCGLKL